MIRKCALYCTVALFVFLLGVLAAPILNRLTVGLERRAAAQRRLGAPNDPVGYEQKRSEFAMLQQTRPIVFLGDSRVEHGQWAELLGRDDVSNRGISGDTTAGVLERLATSVPTSGVVCVIQLGINDLHKGVPVETVVQNFRRIVAFLQGERGAQVVVTSIILGGDEFGPLNKLVAQCNRDLEQLAVQEHARWIDLNAALASDGVLDARFTYDGIHLNGDGYAVMRDTIAPALPHSR